MNYSGSRMNKHKQKLGVRICLFARESLQQGFSARSPLKCFVWPISFFCNIVLLCMTKNSYLIEKTCFVKMRAFWDIALCSLRVDHCFRGAYCLHHPDSGGSTHF
jgi:hypothetical protein